MPRTPRVGYLRGSVARHRPPTRPRSSGRSGPRPSRPWSPRLWETVLKAAGVTSSLRRTIQRPPRPTCWSPRSSSWSWETSRSDRPGLRGNYSEVTHHHEAQGKARRSGQGRPATWWRSASPPVPSCRPRDRTKLQGPHQARSGNRQGPGGHRQGCGTQSPRWRASAAPRPEPRSRATAPAATARGHRGQEPG